MMSNITPERRNGIRMAAAYVVVISDRRGRFLARGRTANISESGIYVIIERRHLPEGGMVNLDITIPDAAGKPGRPDAQRTVRYASRIVRDEPVGQLMGLGIQFVEKIS